MTPTRIRLAGLAAIALSLAAAGPGAAQSSGPTQTPRVTAGDVIDVDRKCLRMGKLAGGLCIYPKIQNSCAKWGADCTEVYGEDTCRCPQLP